MSGGETVVLGIASSLAVLFVIAGLPSDGVPESACPIIEPEIAQPAADPNADPFPRGPWFVNQNRTLWAGWDAANLTAGGNKVLWIKPWGADLKINARKLGARGTPFHASVPCCYPSGFHATVLEFSAPGCWEVSASAGGEQIRFVTWVEPSAIAAGDTLFLRARIAGCDELERVIDYGKVQESGAVILFGVTLSAAGNDATTLAAELADEIGKRQSTRPESLVITVVRPGDHKTRAKMLTLLIGERQFKRRCRIKPYFDLPMALPEYRVALTSPSSTRH